MDNSKDLLTIVVPIGPRDKAWKNIAQELPSDLKIVWSIGEISASEFGNELKQYRSALTDKIINSLPGRANQLNAGATETTTDIVWFLHADSKILSETLGVFKKLSKLDPRTIYYYDLVFTDGSLLMHFNQIGVWLRSRLLKLPFGDQGLIMHKKLFFELGGYPNEPIGEDLIFVRQSANKGIKIQALTAKLGTSARKYKDKWISTTYQHLYWTFKLRKKADLNF